MLVHRMLSLTYAVLLAEDPYVIAGMENDIVIKKPDRNLLPDLIPSDLQSLAATLGGGLGINGDGLPGSRYDDGAPNLDHLQSISRALGLDGASRALGLDGASRALGLIGIEVSLSGIFLVLNLIYVILSPIYIWLCGITCYEPARPYSNAMFLSAFVVPWVLVATVYFSDVTRVILFGFSLSAVYASIFHAELYCSLNRGIASYAIIHLILAYSNVGEAGLRCIDLLAFGIGVLSAFFIPDDRDSIAECVNATFIAALACWLLFGSILEVSRGSVLELKPSPRYPSLIYFADSSFIRGMSLWNIGSVMAILVSLGLWAGGALVNNHRSILEKRTNMNTRIGNKLDP